MAPVASITDVCPARPAHSALVVRLVHVTPAADGTEAPSTPEYNPQPHENPYATLWVPLEYSSEYPLTASGLSLEYRKYRGISCVSTT
jgi:hypothetical protein